MKSDIALGEKHGYRMESKSRIKWRRCEECSKGYFQLDAPSEVKICQKCLNQLDCQGGTNVSTKKRYWRQSNKTIFLIKCPAAEACLWVIKLK